MISVDMIIFFISLQASVITCPFLTVITIYTTKIGEFACPPNISETIVIRIMKFAHRPPIASTTIKLISKPMLLSILYFKKKSANRHWPEAQIVDAICLFTVIRATPLVSISWIISCCQLQICIIWFILLIRPYVLLRRNELWWAVYSNYFHLYYYSTAYIHT